MIDQYNEQIGNNFVWVDSQGIIHEEPWRSSNDSLEDGVDWTVIYAIEDGWTIPKWSQKARRIETYWSWNKKTRKRIRKVCKDHVSGWIKWNLVDISKSAQV